MNKKVKVTVMYGSVILDVTGDLIDITEDEILVETGASQAIINRKFVPIIRFIDESAMAEKAEEASVRARGAQQTKQQPSRPSEREQQYRELIMKKLRFDPLEEDISSILNEEPEMPSYGQEAESSQYIDSTDDEEVQRTVGRAMTRNVFTQENNLTDAIRRGLSSDEEFVVPMGGVGYQSKIKSLIGMKNAGNKKTRGH